MGRRTYVCGRCNATDGDDREARFATVANDRKLPHKAPTSIGKDGAMRKVCSESGPCGLMIYRLPKRPGIDCLVISLSSMPCRPDDRVKSEHRDAQVLARLLRAGEFTVVWLPDQTHEAIGYVVRRQAKQDLVSARNTLKSVLLRHDRRYPGRALSGRMHRRFRIGALLLRTAVPR